MTSLRAGAANADITPTVGGYMDGYSSRRQPSQGVHDPLFARVLILDYDAGGACAIIGCDLLGMHPQVASQVRERALELFGIQPEAIIVSATHNHAGPAGLRAGMFGRLNEALAATVVDSIAAAISKAWASRREATLKTASARLDTIGANRRDPSLPIDGTVRIALSDSADGPIACLVNVACHGTVLNGSNLMLTAEFPGVACRIIEDVTGATPIYLNGACGDINPAWIAQDFESVERLGQVVGGQAVRTIAEMLSAGRGQRIHNVRWDEFPNVPVPGRVVEPRLRFARREVELPARDFLPDDEYAPVIEDARGTADGAPGESSERRAAMARVSRYESERWAAVWAQRSGAGAMHRTEVQAISLGEGLAVIALPGEFFGETGRLIREATGAEQLLIAGYANDYVGYVVPDSEYDEGGYECGVTPCAPGAELIIRQTAIDLLRQVSGNGD